MLPAQLLAVQERFPGACATPLPSGATLIRVPNFRIAGGWNKETVEIRFLAPNGYPYAQPDCFWADESLRLKSEAMPQNSAISQIPETSESGCWFSWHLTQPWNASVDTLLTWIAVIAERFRQAV